MYSRALRTFDLSLVCIKNYFYGSKQTMHTKPIWLAIALVLQHLGYIALPQPSINISVHVCAIYVLRVVAFCSMLRHISIWNMKKSLPYVHYLASCTTTTTPRQCTQIPYICIDFSFQGGFLVESFRADWFKVLLSTLYREIEITSFRSYFVHLLYICTSCTSFNLKRCILTKILKSFQGKIYCLCHRLQSTQEIKISFGLWSF